VSLRRTLLAVTGLAVVAVLVAYPWAQGSSDLYGNVGPGGSVSGLADRYPLGHYALDQHFSAVKASLTGGVDASGVPAMLAFFLANLVWQITAFCANALITLFAFAFSIDLLNGSDATGGAGALAPVSQAIRGLYAHTFGQPWMVIAVTLAGCWAMWHALVQRRYTETAGALGTSLVYCMIALAVVTRPDDTIGYASRLTNQLSTAFLSVTANGEVAGGDQARRAATDQLFAVLIHGPWVALNFGGTEHCIRPGTGNQDHDPESVPVRPLSNDPASDARLRHQLNTAGQVTTAEKACVSNTARYPSHFLPYAPGSDDRDAEYQALNHADPDRLPDSDPAKATGTYRPAMVDKPATDAMEKGGQDQRLLLALVVLACELGAFLLLGALSVSVLLAQVVVLVLACFAPVALVAGIVPGRGHDAFRAWTGLLASYLVRKAAYSLVLAVLLAVLSALQDATTNLGWLMSFALQALLLWIVYLQRHTLAARLTSTLTGHSPGRDAQLRRLLRLRTALPAVPHARRPAPNPTPSPSEREPSRNADPRPTTDPDALPAVATAADRSVDEAHPAPAIDRTRPPRRVPRQRPVSDDAEPPGPPAGENTADATATDGSPGSRLRGTATSNVSGESARRPSRRARRRPAPTSDAPRSADVPPAVKHDTDETDHRLGAAASPGHDPEPSLADELQRDRERLRQPGQPDQADHADPPAPRRDDQAPADGPRGTR
jgi:hypothetical protein